MIALYVRVSTQEQAKEGYSVEEQIERLKKYSEAQGRKDYELYVDGGYSGSNTDRPDLRRMLQDISKKKLEKVIVYKLDRLSRSQRDTLYLIEDVFLKNGVDFESMSEKFDTATPFGKAMVGILAVFAQLEREQIKERMAIGREGRAKAGKWRGSGNAPVGYDYVGGVLKVNEYEAMQVKELFSLYVTGYPLGRIESIFNDKGYSHKYGKWNRTRVREVVRNKVYTGVILKDGEEYKGIHEPIISDELFEKAKKIFDDRYIAYTEKNQTSKQLSYFGGLMFCKRCGARYFCIGATDKGKRYRYYSCYSRRKSNKVMVKDASCKNLNYREKDFNDLIFSEIKKLETDPEYVLEIQNRDEAKLELRKKSETLKAEVNKLDAQRSRLIDLYALGSFSAEELEEKVISIRAHREHLLRELEDIKVDENKLDSESVRVAVKGFSDILERGIYEEIRLVIETLIDRIEIDGENIEIHWRFA